MINTILSLFFGTKHERDIKKLKPIVQQINALEDEVKKLTQDQMLAKTTEFRGRIENGQPVDDLLPYAFAMVREAAWRTIGMRHFDVQLMGAIVLHQGKISEMKTGEGKTLVATMPVYLNALAGKGVHVVTVNDYLARRDSEWMGPIYKYLGLTVGVIQHNMDYYQRQQSYRCDVTYGTNNEFGFDYLRALFVEDRIILTIFDKAQIAHTGTYSKSDIALNILAPTGATFNDTKELIVIFIPCYEEEA